MTTKLKPVNCACGRKAKVEDVRNYRGAKLWWVNCNKENCWVGPERKTPAAAVQAWNRVMKKDAQP